MLNSCVVRSFSWFQFYLFLFPLLWFARLGFALTIRPRAGRLFSMVFQFFDVVLFTILIYAFYFSSLSKCTFSLVSRSAMHAVLPSCARCVRFQFWIACKAARWLLSLVLALSFSVCSYVRDSFFISFEKPKCLFNGQTSVCGSALLC